MSWVTPLPNPLWEPIDTRPGRSPYDDDEDDE